MTQVVGGWSWERVQSTHSRPTTGTLPALIWSIIIIFPLCSISQCHRKMHLNDDLSQGNCNWKRAPTNCIKARHIGGWGSGGSGVCDWAQIDYIGWLASGCKVISYNTVRVVNRTFSGGLSITCGNGCDTSSDPIKHVPCGDYIFSSGCNGKLGFE